MSKYDAASLVNLLRKRIGLEREAMLTLCYIDDSTFRRIENGKQHPKMETLKMLIEAINLPLDGFIYSPLDDLPMETLLLCDRLNQLLDINELNKAELLLNQIENLAIFDTGVLLQFKLSKKARLWDLQERPPEDIFPLIEEGMKETYFDYKSEDIFNTVLVLEEPELIYTKARLLMKIGNINDSVTILEHMVNNLSKIPSADQEKERFFAQLVLSLAECLIIIGDYNRVIELCDIGSKYSATRKQGNLNPDFELQKAFALRGLGRMDECKAPLQHAFFGFVLLGNIERANEILTIAHEDFNIQFQTYDVNNLKISNKSRVPYNRGESVFCYSLGTLIRALRKKAGLSLSQLSRGICSKPTLLRIENDETNVNYFIIEAIMQRLGRDINFYNNFFLSKDAFILVQMCDRIRVLLIENQYKTASKMLVELEKSKYFIKNNVTMQFAKMVRAILFASEYDAPQPEYPTMLIDALKITCPQFDETEIEKCYLTFNEIAIISQYAAYYGDINDPNRSACIYDRLHKNISGKYKDEIEKSRMYSTILFNFSSALGRSGYMNEALEIITEGEIFERNRGRLINLPGFAFNKGYSLLMSNKKTECIPFLILAYYGTSLFAKYGQEHYLPTIQNVLIEHLNIAIA